MNVNMATMSDSLRELHDKRRHVVSADHSDHTAEPANKAAKTAENDPADVVLSAVKNLLDSEESGTTEGELSSHESLLDSLAKLLDSQDLWSSKQEVSRSGVCLLVEKARWRAAQRNNWQVL